MKPSKFQSAKPAQASAYPPGVRMSNNHYMERFRMLISGPSGCGKTFTAATISKYWPTGSLEIQGEELVLKDLVWVSVDAGATTGLGQYNISVPEISIREDLMCPAKKGESKSHQKSIIPGEDAQSAAEDGL